jgi:type II secretory pathway component HofQ
MNRLLFLILVTMVPQSSFAAVYKCEREGGKVEYQASPCEKGREVPITTTGPVAPSANASPTPRAAVSSEKKKCVGKELRINFTSMPVKATLQVIADFSGNKLAADASVSGVGAFNYECVPWDTVLKDIASRHNLVVKVEKGTIFATKH